MLFLFVGVFLSAYGVGGTMKIDIMGIQIAGGLGGVIIVLVLLAVLYDKYLKRKSDY